MKRNGRAWNGLVSVWVLLCVMMPPAVSTANAGQKVVEIEGVAYHVAASMAENLKALEGKIVNITLDTGTPFAGKIKAVGNHLVHLEELKGKEYFDALIRIEAIRAIDTRFREYQR